MRAAATMVALLWPVLALTQPVGCVQSSSSCTCYSGTGRKVETAPGLCRQLFQQPVLVHGGELRLHESPPPPPDQVEPLRMPLPLIGMGDVRKIVREAASGP